MTSEFNNRYVSLERETGYGTGADGDAEIFGEVDDESFAMSFDMLTRSDISRQISSKMQTGTEYSDGTINMAAQIDDFLGHVLHGILPDDKRTLSGSAQLHTMKPASYALSAKLSTSDAFNVINYPDTGSGPASIDVDSYCTYQGDVYRCVTAISSAEDFDAAKWYKIGYPSYTVRVGREQKEHTFTGMMVDSFSLTANVGEYVMISADFVGKAESDIGALDTPDFSGEALSALHFANGNVYFNANADGTYGGATAVVKGISLDISMNRDTDNAYGLGSSTYRTAPASQLMEITGSIDFNEVVYTSTTDVPTWATLIQEGGLEYKSSAQAYNDASVMKLEFIEEGAVDNKMVIELFHLRFDAPTGAGVSGRDSNTMTVGFTALVNPVSGKSIEIGYQGASLSNSSYTEMY